MTVKKEDSLIEYLYIDERRLDEYFEQISPPVMYDKVPIWKTVLGLFGPKVEATQSRPGRPFTTHEKVTRFHHHLKKDKLLIEHRPVEPFEMELRDDSNSSNQFRLEQMSAQRVRLNKVDEDIEINIWVSLQPDRQIKESRSAVGALFLIEDFRGNDDRVTRISGFSSLWFLVQEMKPLIELANSNIFDQADKIEDRFGEDPIGTLKDLGAQFGPSRRIQATYRIRVCGMEMGARDHATTTVGYPIVISAL